MSVLAVDWSGRRAGERRYLWIAEAVDGVLVGLEAGRSRVALIDHLVARLEADPTLVVGFDFSFSLPVWFLDDRGYATAPDLWDAAAREGEQWLQSSAPPFWGRPGRPRPLLTEHFRITEAHVGAVGGIRPKSTFQIGGAGSVGTGSVRGFPALVRLRTAGFAIWPFDAPAHPPVVVEIYPRTMTGPVVKSDPAARVAHLDRHHPGLDPGLRDRRDRQRGRVRRGGVCARDVAARVGAARPTDASRRGRTTRGLGLEPPSRGRTRSARR